MKLVEKIKERKRQLFFVFLAMLALTLSVYATNILDCTNITSSDTYYLTADILSSSAVKCMNITAADVTLDCQGHQIRGINASNTFGIYIDTGATNTVIQNCSVTSWGGGWNLGYGIYMASSGNTIIDTNTTTNKGAGIGLISSSNNVLTDIFSDSNWWEGINFISSNNNTLTDISTSGNHGHGIQLDSSHNNTFSFITMSAKNSYFGFTIMNSYNNSVKNVYLYHDTVYLTNSNNSEFDNITAIGYTNGGSDGAIYLINSNNNIYSNINSSSNHGSGVSLYLASTNNNFTNISVISNTNYGIFLQSGANNNIFNNVVAKSSTYGLYLQPGANNNTFNNTNTSSVNYGVYMASSGNTISNSTIKGSSSNGIYMTSSGSSALNIFYNNLFNNTNNIYFASSIYDNSWNTTNQSGIKIYSAGTNIGGNYWTNPSGTGYSDACMDASADGFCDTPYDVLNNVGCTAGVNCSNNTDYLPYAATPTYSVVWNSPQNAVWSNSWTIDHIYTPTTTTNPFTECDLVTDISGTTLPVASNATPLQNNAQNTITYDYGADNNSFASYMTCIASDGYHSTSTVVMKIDSVPPSQVTNLASSSHGSDWVYLTWDASTDSASGVQKYAVWQDGVNIGNTTHLYYNATGLTHGTHAFFVGAIDHAENWGSNSTELDLYSLSGIIGNCANITAPGNYDVITTLTGDGYTPCIDIQVDNVVLDCHNNQISAGYPSDIQIVRTSPEATNVQISNCDLTGDPIYGPYQALYLANASFNTITNVSTHDITLAGGSTGYPDASGIYLETSDSNVFSDITVYNIYPIAGGTSGIDVLDSNNNSFSSMTLWNNTGQLGAPDILLNNSNSSRINGVILLSVYDPGSGNWIYNMIDLEGSHFNTLNAINGPNASIDFGQTFSLASNSNILNNCTINNVMLSGINNTIANNTIQSLYDFGTSSIYLQDLGSGVQAYIYNNLLNSSTNVAFFNLYGLYSYSITWNVAKQPGTRIFSSGPQIAGNYWSNPTGTGYSDTCTDANHDGFCDSAYSPGWGECYGSPSDCGYLTETACLANGGCSWNGVSCEGSPYDCNTFGDLPTCTLVGCSWNANPEYDYFPLSNQYSNSTTTPSLDALPTTQLVIIPAPGSSNTTTINLSVTNAQANVTLSWSNFSKTTATANRTSWTNFLGNDSVLINISTLASEDQGRTFTFTFSSTTPGANNVSISVDTRFFNRNFSVVWNAPLNNTWNTSQTITVQFTPTDHDSPITGCSLWSNASGAFGPEASNSTPLVNNSVNSISYDFGADSNQIIAYMNCSNSSGSSETTNDIIIKIDTIPPLQVTGLANATTGATFSLITWDPGIDAGSGIQWYIIWKDGINVVNTTNTFYWDDTLAANTSYDWQVQAEDNVNLIGSNSTDLTFTTLATNPPNAILNCVDINASGSYDMVADISKPWGFSPVPCIIISADDVALDCHGHTIVGYTDYGHPWDRDPTQAFYISRNASTNTNAVLKNCNVQNLDNGIYLGNASNNTFNGLTVHSYLPCPYWPNCGVYHPTLSACEDPWSTGPYGHGIELESSSNNRFWNLGRVVSYGVSIFMQDSSNNDFENASLIPEYIWGILPENGIDVLNGAGNIFNNLTIHDATFRGFCTINSPGTSLQNTEISNALDSGINSYYIAIDMSNSSGSLLHSVNLNGLAYSIAYKTGISIGSSSNLSLQAIWLYAWYQGLVLDSITGSSIGSISWVGNSHDTILTNFNNNSFANSTIAVSGFSLDDISSGNIFYNNLFDGIPSFNLSNSWNTTLQLGTRIHGSGPAIGGNFWDGYSDTCIDANHNGFCDVPYDLLDNVGCTLNCSNNTDYLPLSNDYNLSVVISYPSNNSAFSTSQFPVNITFTVSGYFSSYNTILLINGTSNSSAIVHDSVPANLILPVQAPGNYSITIYAHNSTVTGSASIVLSITTPVTPPVTPPPSNGYGGLNTTPLGPNTNTPATSQQQATCEVLAASSSFYDQLEALIKCDININGALIPRITLLMLVLAIIGLIYYESKKEKKFDAVVGFILVLMLILILAFVGVLAIEWAVWITVGLVALLILKAMRIF